MLDKQVAKLLTEQVTKEFYSAYLYLDISNYYTNKSLNGFGNWFKVQAQEERDHAMLFVTYLLNNDQEVVFGDIKAPGEKYGDFKAPLTLSYAHEQSVTASIYNIYEAASAVRDFRTMQFLDWFVKEQGEEEKNAKDLIDRYELFGYDSKSLYMLDSELGTRIYTPPTLVL